MAGGAVLAGLLLPCYLMGPAAYVRVDTSQIVVGNAFTRTTIPRGAVREVAGWDWLEVVIYGRGTAGNGWSTVDGGPAV